jgi:hypothetical protein
VNTTGSYDTQVGKCNGTIGKMYGGRLALISRPTFAQFFGPLGVVCVFLLNVKNELFQLSPDRPFIGLRAINISSTLDAHWYWTDSRNGKKISFNENKFFHFRRSNGKTAISELWKFILECGRTK